jgi:ketosteroid isomerase-like protein
MKLAFAIIAIAIAAIPSMADHSESVKDGRNNKAEQEFRQLGEQWLNAIARRDTVTLDRILAEDIVITDAFGKVSNKAQELARRRVFVHNIGYHNTVEEVRVYGEAAVVTGLHTVRVQPPQKRVYWVKYRYTFVWSKLGERWQMVAQQFTRISED